MDLTNSDLRVVNLIIYEDKICQVSDILSSESVILCGIEESIKTTKIEGLLIDDSILIKLGANKTQIGDFDKFRLEIKDFMSVYFCVKWGAIINSFLFVTQDSATGARFNISFKIPGDDDKTRPITFIHELQNLFFVFNNYEMDIDNLL
jgi:hypothetical protein